MHSFENNTYFHFKYLAIKQLKGFCVDQGPVLVWTFVRASKLYVALGLNKTESATADWSSKVC